MSYHIPQDPSLELNVIRVANRLRLPLFKNKKGEPAHSQPDGSDWSLGDWSNATLGELGEAANLIKKITRGDITLEETREELGKELADVLTYLDILAFRLGIDLGEAMIQKWNEVSDRVGAGIQIQWDRVVVDNDTRDEIIKHLAGSVPEELRGPPNHKE